MNHRLEFQVLLLPNVPGEELLARFQHVEELGFDLVATADHFVDWRYPKPSPTDPWLEGWTTLAAAARETSHIKLATYVTQIPLRNPAILARQALTVDQISAGRLVIGLGIGLTSDPSYGMMGLANWPLKERVARFGEYVEIIDLLLRQETTSYDGSYYTIRDAVMIPRPIQQPRPPIAVGTIGRNMLMHVARFADIWNSIGRAGTLEGQLAETRERIEILEEHCHAVGRDPGEIRRSYVLLDKPARDVSDAIPYYASKDAFVEAVERFRELGISEFMLDYPVLESDRPTFETIAQDVIPALRR
ncbi:MAG: LLM class flavin-dependent oxidoreductase [Alphaproteobacteria bacterium]|nr:LLM class flavin-dependent oxidoreductase [Alphaproteobacteria bacterium]